MFDKLKAKASSLRLRIPQASANLKAASASSASLAGPAARNSFGDTDYYRQTKEEIHSPVSWVTLYGSNCDSPSEPLLDDTDTNAPIAIQENVSAIHLHRAQTFEDQVNDITSRSHNPLLDHVNSTDFAHTFQDSIVTVDDDGDDDDLKFHNPLALKRQLMLNDDLRAPKWVKPTSAIVQAVTRGFQDSLVDGPGSQLEDGPTRHLILGDEPEPRAANDRRNPTTATGVAESYKRNRRLSAWTTLDTILSKASRRRAPNLAHDNGPNGADQFASETRAKESSPKRQSKGRRVKGLPATGNLRSKSMPSFF
ncbi:hypothetical protein MIND_00923100 [Mycena indigotica]|uniref:Uncharacterized protein n=1 Tax=Mycena indigotica TaxID=2126181 RepID=A0A8H6W0B8_9AGAR|nr:uncharacterized protein MIND_00923100 [Mycena indigotica]KAF7296913.1 hypothetical protein MIND_00923100 [Mycena indigotica]